MSSTTSWSGVGLSPPGASSPTKYASSTLTSTSPALMSGVMLATFARSPAISARPERAAEPRRSMSSEEGGVGRLRSSSVRRWRDSRAGELRPPTGLYGFDFRAVRLVAFFFGLGFRALAAFFSFEVRLALLGRLAERAARRVFFAIFRVALRPLVFRLAMA